MIFNIDSLTAKKYSSLLLQLIKGSAKMELLSLNIKRDRLRDLEFYLDYLRVCLKT